MSGGEAFEVARSGVFGGTFNPVHLGHLRAAEEVREALGLERVIFVASARPPHKGEAEESVAPPRLRHAWLAAAVADNPRFEADPIEVERAGPSYSVDTLRALAERVAPERPVFLIGHDAFREIDTWREPERLFALCHLAVLTRPPERGGGLAEWIPERLAPAFALAPDGRSGRHREAGTWIRRVAIDGLDVSATDVRRRLREGRSARYLVPEEARAAIVKSGAYAARSPE